MPSYRGTEGQVPVSDRIKTEGQVPVSDRIGTVR